MNELIKNWRRTLAWLEAPHRPMDNWTQGQIVLLRNMLREVDEYQTKNVNVAQNLEHFGGS